MQLIPIRQEAAYFKFTTELDGITYTLTFRWNGRAGQWVLDFGDGEGNVVKAGIRCVVSNLLLERSQGEPNIPPGYLVFFDTSGAGLDMAYADLGRRVQLFYISAAEYPALIAQAAAEG